MKFIFKTIVLFAFFSFTFSGYLEAQNTMWIGLKQYSIRNIFPETNGYSIIGQGHGVGIKKMDAGFNTTLTAQYLFKKDTFTIPPFYFSYYIRKGIKLHSDSSFVLIGYLFQNPIPPTSPVKPFVLKLTNSGDTVWHNVISNAEYAYDGIETTDGGIIAVGKYFYGKFNSMDGHLEWNKSFNATNGYGCHAESCSRTLDSMTVITGYVFFNLTDADVFVLKIDDSGNVQWVKYYRTSVNEVGSSISATKDGGYLITGIVNYGNSSSEDMLVMKINSIGNLLWANKFDYKGTSDEGVKIIETVDKGYMAEVAGAYDSVFVFKGDSLGNREWSILIPGYYFNEGTYEFLESPNNGYFIANGGLIEIDSTGGFCYSGVDSLTQSAYNVTVDTFSVYGLSGYYSDPTIYIDTVSQGTDSLVDVCLYLATGELSNQNFTIVLFPSPASDLLTIRFPEQLQQQKVTIKIFDTLGNEMLGKTISSQQEIKLPTQNIANGIYFLQVITAEQKMFCKKILIMH